MSALLKPTQALILPKPLRLVVNNPVLYTPDLFDSPCLTPEHFITLHDLAGFQRHMADAEKINASDAEFERFCRALEWGDERAMALFTIITRRRAAGFSSYTDTFTSGTAATSNIPTGCVAVLPQLYGGGGAGGFSSTLHGGGGGGSGYAAKAALACVAGDVVTRTIGASVAGRSTNGTGTSGNASSVSATLTGSGALSMTANGGVGGGTNSGGTGGSASGGTTNTTGQAGSAPGGGVSGDGGQNNGSGGGAGAFGNSGADGSSPGGGGGGNDAGTSGGGADGALKLTYS